MFKLIFKNLFFTASKYDILFLFRQLFLLNILKFFRSLISDTMQVFLFSDVN
jgi:hypothetical protein